MSGSGLRAAVLGFGSVWDSGVFWPGRVCPAGMHNSSITTSWSTHLGPFCFIRVSISWVVKTAYLDLRPGRFTQSRKFAKPFKCPTTYLDVVCTYLQVVAVCAASLLY